MREPATFDAEFGSRFCLTVDTEESFDWDGPFSRVDHHCRAVPALAEGQAFFAAAHVVPTYFMDYPVATNAACRDALGSAFADGAAEVGTHLHPWVTPPYAEAINPANSYAGNLPAHIEAEKLAVTTNAIAENFGIAPKVYRAGRYGIGPNSYKILRDAGYVVDSSIRPLFDYRDQGGPDFSHEGCAPWWTDDEQQLLEVPLTTCYLGWGAKRWGADLYPALAKRPVTMSLAARSRMLSRIPLTPEGTPVRLACAAIDRALADKLPVLLLSFHSPSLAIGGSPYVRDADDLKQFYRWFDTVFNHMAKRGVRSSHLGEIYQMARQPT